VLELVTKQGIQPMNIDATTKIKTIRDRVQELDNDQLLFIICRRAAAELTFFDLLLAKLGVAVLILTPTQGVIYPANLLKRRASALCVTS
jgi:hypothetical protein